MSLVALRAPGLFEAHCSPSEKYESVAVPVLTRYTSVTVSSNICYDTLSLCSKNGSSQLDLFI